MKKTKIMIPFFFFVIFLIGCKNTQKINNIIVKSSVTLGSAALDNLGYDDYELALLMCEGYYSEDYAPSRYQGSNWCGDFKLAVIDMTTGNIINEYDIIQWDEKLNFKNKIIINLKDYNNDGNQEFLIGQYGTSNYNYYRMYYITKDLEIGCYENIGEFKISDKSEQQFSPILDVVTNNIIYSLYNIESGKWIEYKIALDELKIE